MHGYDILCGISKGAFEIPHKISYPYIERCGFYSLVKIQELLDLRAHKCFWNAPGLIHPERAFEIISTEVGSIVISASINHDILTHWGRDKWTPFRRRHFQMHFLEWNCLNSD